MYQSPCPTGQANLPPLDGEEQPELVFYPPLEILMETAILTPSGNGTTPIEAIFSSLSPLFDSDSMCLYVSNMPVNYTAQQLLKLFQTRYPSAYKAEMFKVMACKMSYVRQMAQTALEHLMLAVKMHLGQCGSLVVHV